MLYDGDSAKVPSEYWEYRLVEDHFMGNWLVYWQMPEPWINLIVQFKNIENRATEIQNKRLEQKYGRKQASNNN